MTRAAKATVVGMFVLLMAFGLAASAIVDAVNAAFVSTVLGF